MVLVRLLNSQAECEWIPQDAIAILGLGDKRVRARRQAYCEGKSPHARAGLGAVAQQRVGTVDLHVEGHLGDGRARIGVGEIRRGQANAWPYRAGLVCLLTSSEIFREFRQKVR